MTHFPAPNAARLFEEARRREYELTKAKEANVNRILTRHGFQPITPTKIETALHGVALFFAGLTVALLVGAAMAWVAA